jgi:hypothetical protein
MHQRPLTPEEICNKLRPIFGKKIDEIYYQYTVAQDRQEKEEILQIITTLYQKNLSELLGKSVLLEPPKQEQLDGTYYLADIVYANKKVAKFNLREQDWPRHMCVTGMSGSGKTTFAFRIIETLDKNEKPYLIFDWKKSFRPLLSKNKNVLLFTVGDSSTSNFFKTNINQPPKSVPPKEWINVLADLLTESFQASYGVHKVILETLDEAFKEWGIYNGSDNYPTWNHIKWRLEEKLKKANNRESGWIESALRVATVLTFGEFGKTLNYKGEKAVQVEDLLNKKVIMELNSLGGVEKTVFCEFLLTYIYKLKKARQNQVKAKFDHAIIVDEAHNIFLKKPTNFTNESTTDMIYREMREYGTSLICLDQHVSKISDTVKGNSAVHIAFQQQLPQDIYDISELTQLHDHRHYFSSLPVGSAIVKLSERYNQPFQVKVPYDGEREEFVTNENIKLRMDLFLEEQNFNKGTDKKFNKQLLQEEQPKQEIKKEIKLTETQDMIQNYIKEHFTSGIPIENIISTLESSKTQGGYTTEDIEIAQESLFPNSKITNLTEDEITFLKFLKENPDHKLATTQIYKKLGLSARKGTITKKSLEEKNLIRIEELKYEKGWKKLIRLT